MSEELQKHRIIETKDLGFQVGGVDSQSYEMPQTRLYGSI